MTTTDTTVIRALVDAAKATRFSAGTKPADTDAFGLLMAEFFGYNSDILLAASRALEDANLHTQAAQVTAMHTELVRACDNDPIDDDMRKALLARMSEVYGRSITTADRRADRLAKLSALTGERIWSVSRRGNMTVGHFRRAMEVLDTLK